VAKQTRNPAPWVPGSGDGCSGVFDLGYKKACDWHDMQYARGGNVEDKLIVDDQFYHDMCSAPNMWGWLARRGLAGIRYRGVRMFTFNYPPNHPMRKQRKLKIEAFNWLGPGPI
tara:strand:+ start:1873 stop:2214 length:342 start_codon:yes stop_codon:yes gene_type:complete